ncbi:MAG: RDD family protein [Gammaproteobacteria bacterium]|nr:RDD family protein [Gammaproteobacteria bacterium]
MPRRLLAICYDALLLGSVLFAATFALLPFSGGVAIRPDNPLYAIYLTTITYLYYAWPWLHGGQTLGMRAWGIRLVRAGGGAPRVRDTLLRFAGALVSTLPLGLGFLYALADRDGRALHDLVSGTRLIRVDPDRNDATAGTARRN